MSNRAAAALTALGDPTRREVLLRLARGPQAVSSLAAQLPISRPAVSQHLKILKAAGLVTDSAEGTRRIYRIDPSGIGAVREWLEQFWDTALESFKKYADSLEEEEEP